MVEVNRVTEEFLAERPTLTLGTIRGDGSPQASVLWYLWQDGAFIMSTIHTTAKWKNLLRDPRCSICIEDPETGQMVVAYGSAELEDTDVRDLTWAIVDRYYDDESETEAHMERIFATDDRVLITLRPRELITRRLD